MSSNVEIEWLSNNSETLAFWKSTKPRRDMSVLSKETRKRSSEALKDYDYLESRLEKSVLMKQGKLEKLVSLMKEEEGDRIRMSFGDDKPLFFEKKRANKSVTFRGIIAPMIGMDDETESQETSSSQPEWDDVIPPVNNSISNIGVFIDQFEDRELDDIQQSEFEDFIEHLKDARNELETFKEQNYYEEQEEAL